MDGSSLADLARRLSRHTDSEGQTETAIPNLLIIRRTASERPFEGAYKPLICLVVEGAKRVSFGAGSIDVCQGEMIVTAAETPVSSRVAATRAAPFLAMSLLLDLDTVADLAAQLGLEPGTERRSLPISRLDPSPELWEALGRLAGLLDTPTHIPVLAPLVEREIAYRLLRHPSATALRLVANDSRVMASVRRVAAWIKDNPTQDVRVAELAAMAKMSAATFHRHFRAATSLSPLQFQKQMRLHEARRRMLVLSEDAAVAAHQVGYQSAAQFSREYKRLYGDSPTRNVAKGRDKGMIASSPS